MPMQPLDLSLCDIVLIDDPFMDIHDAALFGPDYIFVHNLQTRRQRFPRGLGIADFPQWFEAKRMLVPYETRVSRLGAVPGQRSEHEFAPVYVAPDTALLDAKRIFVPAPSIAELEIRRGAINVSNVPSNMGEAFEVGQSRFHVLHDFYIACAETTTDPVATLQALVAKTEGYQVRRVWGPGRAKNEESLDLSPAVVINREHFLKEILARRLEERFFWNWKLHAIVASRRGSRDLEWPVGIVSNSRWEDMLGNPFAVQMLYRIWARQDEGFPVSEIRPWSGTGRYAPEDIPRHWRGSLVRSVRRAVEDKECSAQPKRVNRHGKRSSLSDAISSIFDELHDELQDVKLQRFCLTERASEFLNGLHPDCQDIDLPLRLMKWLEAPDQTSEAAMARYLRTWFGKLLRHHHAERKVTSEVK